MEERLKRSHRLTANSGCRGPGNRGTPIAAVLALCLALTFLAAPQAKADYTATETSTLFGSLVQPAWPTPSQSPNGNSAFYDCTQTAIVNAFVYLQNQYGSTYGTSLTVAPNLTGNYLTVYNAGGGASNSLNATAMVLNSGSSTGTGHLIPTTWTQNPTGTGPWSASEGGQGTVAWGLYHYVLNQAGVEPSTYFYAETTTMTNWTSNGSSSSWATNPPNGHVSGIAENPTWSFLYNGLNAGDAVLINWQSLSGQAHWLTLTSINFNTTTDKATISYVDPQGGQHNNVPIFMNSNGTIGLYYSNATNPWYTGNVEVTGALVLGPTSLSPLDMSGALSLASGGGWHWVGGNGDWNANPSLWNSKQDGTGSPAPGSGIPPSGSTAYIQQSSSSTSTPLLTVTYSGSNYSGNMLGSIQLNNTAATGSFTGGTPDTGVGWVMLNQTGGTMNANAVKIGALGAYMLSGGTLDIQSSEINGSWTTGTLGAGGYITDTKDGRPYEGGIFYQSGGMVQTAAVSLGWSSSRSAPADGVYALLNGTLTVADDTGGSTAIASGSPTPGTMSVGVGGNGNFMQGFAPVIPTSGPIYTNSVGFTYGSGGSVTTNNLYVGITSPSVQTGTDSNGNPIYTTYYGNGSYSLLYGNLNVGNNAYIGSGGSSTSVSSGDFQQGYFNPSKISYNTAVVGGGTSKVMIGGNLYFGQSGGSGSYELYNGTLMVAGNSNDPARPAGTNGGIYIGFGGTQGSSFTQGQPYQDPTTGTWTTYPASWSLSTGWTGNVVTAPNLYIGMGQAPGNGQSQYTLADGFLGVAVATYVGYSGPGNFTQGQWMNNSTPMLTPGGTFQTGTLYIGGSPGTSGTGTYNLYNGTLNVSGTTYVGSSGTGTFNQSGGTFTAGAISIGSSSTYKYSGGTITGAITNSGNLTVTPASGTNTFAASITNNAGGTVSVNGGNVTFTGAVTNNSPIQTAIRSGGFAINGGNVTFTGAVTNNAGGMISQNNNNYGAFSINQATVVFNTFLNAANATFTTNQSTVTFNGLMTNNGQWITDPSTIIFNGNFTQSGSITSSGDTFEFTSGSHTITLGGSGTTTYLSNIVLESGAYLTVSGGGTLAYTNLSGSTGSNITLSTGSYMVQDSSPSPVPIPGAIWLFVPGLACLAAFRKRIRK